MSKHMSADSVEVIDNGKIEGFNLPIGWVEVEVTPNANVLWSMREFRPMKDSDVRLSIFHRGGPVSDSSAKSFRDVLNQPVHSLTYDEFWSVQQVLRDAALPDQFELLLAETIEVNGLTVLSVHGSWPKLKVDSHSIFIDADGLATQVQEIHFFAARDQYDAYWGDVQNAIASIKWKNVPIADPKS